MGIVSSATYPVLNQYPVLNPTLQINKTVFRRVNDHRHAYRNKFRLNNQNIKELTFRSKIYFGTHLPIKNNANIVRKREWSLSLFDNTTDPHIIGEIYDKKSFDERSDEILFVHDMPIKMRGDTTFQIPGDLEHFFEAFDKIISHEKSINPDFVDYYAYVCVDQRPVKPNKTQRRKGAHSISFPIGNVQRKGYSDSVYIVYNSIPTEFCQGNFRFDLDLDFNDSQSVLQHFDKRTTDFKTFNPYKILMLDSGHVCREGENRSDQIINRTFLKVVFTKDMFNFAGNTHNFFFDYDWTLRERKDKRNPSVSVGGYASENIIPCINKTQMKELFNTAQTSNYFKSSREYIKNSRVIVTVPNESERIGRYGYYPNGTYGKYTLLYDPVKIVNTSDNTEYFLSMSDVRKYYSYIAPGSSMEIDMHKITTDRHNSRFIINANGYFWTMTQMELISNKSETIKARLIMKDISIYAPWGAMQYLSIGDYLIQRSDGTIYGVSGKTFCNTYRLVQTNNTSKE